jgi:hypothetical protein
MIQIKIYREEEDHSLVGCVGCLVVVLGLFIFLASACNALSNFVLYGTFDQQEAQKRATATQVVKDAPELLAKAQKAIDSGDYYIAATILVNIARYQPDNQNAQMLLDQIADYIPGGLVVGGQKGVYYPFDSASETVFVDNIYGKLVGLSPDGQRALIEEDSTDIPWSVLELETGEFTAINQYPDRTLQYVIRGGKLTNIFSGEVKKVKCQESYDLNGLWSGDGTWLAIADDGDKVKLMDFDTGSCQNITIPGSRYGIALTNGTQIWIIVKGDFANSKNARLVSLDMSGKIIEELGEIDSIYEPETILIAPDSSALYVYDKNYGSKIVSLRTGLSADAVDGAIAWVEKIPAKARISPPKLEINPSKVPVGNSFDINLKNGEPGIAIDIVIKPDPWNYSNSRNLSFPIYKSDRFTNSNGQFTAKLETGVNTPSGTYTITVYKSQSHLIIAETTFEILLPR